jgi:hypothetical protein
MAYANVRYKIGKALLLRAEAGYIFYQNIHYTQTDVPTYNFPLRSGLYVQAGFSILFGKTVWEKIFENITFR